MVHLQFCLVVYFVVLTQSIQSELINLASLSNGAGCSSSSDLGPTTTCEEALDSIETPGESEWISARDGTDAFILIIFQQMSSIQQIKVLQRCYYGDKIKNINLMFSDGHSRSVSLSCSGGSESTDCDTTDWESFDVAIDSTISMNVSVTGTCEAGGFTGFREISVLGEYVVNPPMNNLVAMQKGGTCEASSVWSSTYSCRHAIDGVIGPASGESWCSGVGEGVGGWITFTLPSLSKVNELRIMNRCLPRQQMKTILIEYSDGSTDQKELYCYPGTEQYDCPDQDWNIISVASKETTTVKITCLEVCETPPDYTCFQEVEIYGRAELNQACPFDFVDVPELSSCYKIIQEKNSRLNVTQAATACATVHHQSSHLVEINSFVEQDYLTRVLERDRWAGVSCAHYWTNEYRAEEGSEEWFWASTGEHILVPYWADGEPDMPTRRHLSLDDWGNPDHNWKWNAAVGAHTECYICEIGRA